MSNGKPNELWEELAAIELGIRIEAPELAAALDRWEPVEHVLATPAPSRAPRSRGALKRIASSLLGSRSSAAQPQPAPSWHDTVTVLPGV